ncbi:MAG: hypothetical protein SPK32_07100, partial [Bacteroidaceae bacterium]|nr:hypothetical protein [Bacteroidaceae bacterium]
FSLNSENRVNSFIFLAYVRVNEGWFESRRQKTGTRQSIVYPAKIRNNLLIAIEAFQFFSIPCFKPIEGLQ